MTKFDVSSIAVESLLGSIREKEIAIPEIQRPFVWKGTKVCSLIDSLYNGFPVGYLIMWNNPTVRLKDGKDAGGKKVIIDGQQRITALMSAIVGIPILTEDYDEKIYKIAFNPLALEETERFAVQNAAHLKSKHWISDISKLFNTDFDILEFIEGYCNDNPTANKKEINGLINKLLVNIKTAQIGVITLSPGLDISEVTDIFVRINSQGKRLSEADFAMSKIAADERFGGNMLRKAIDYFCHLSANPSFFSKLSSADKLFMGSEYSEKIKWLKDDKADIYIPDYSDMLRVSFMHTFGRAKLGDLVSLLSGRDFADKKFKETIAEESFLMLKTGVLNFVNNYNFEQFVLAIRSAGFVTSKLLGAQLPLDFAYTLYLILQKNNHIDKSLIKKYVQKWFVISTLTTRYSGSFESQMERDLREIESKGFMEFFNETEASELSDNFWNVTMVQNLETQSNNSPYFKVFLAAQVYQTDLSFLSNSAKVADLIIIMGDIHHIFPKEYLKNNGFSDINQYNQVANYTYLDTPINIIIGKKAPNEYLPTILKQCKEQKDSLFKSEEDFFINLQKNCIPKTTIQMTAKDYPEFLKERRKLMATKIKEYYESL